MRIRFQKLEHLRTDGGHGRPAPGVLFGGLKGRRSMRIRAIFHARFRSVVGREGEPRLADKVVHYNVLQMTSL